MTLRFSRKEIIILIVTLTVACILILGSYFFYVSPKKDKVQASEAQLKIEEQLLASIQGNQQTSKIPTVESIAELQRKIPVKQQLEQLILELEKAEVISGSLISNMSFAEADIAAPAPQTPPAQEQPKEDAKTETTDQNNTANQTGTVPNANATPAPTPVPTGIKKLTVTLAVQSPSYYELIKFIETLEGLNRLVVVESVAFSGGTELTKVEDKQGPLSYTLTFSAFYMPTLEDLQDSLPELKPPAPSNKTNPLPSFPEIINEDELE